MLRWYVSYAWGDDTPEGVDREKVVNQLCIAVAARGTRILRDKEELAPGDRISAFMQQIGIGDRIFVILSEKCLRSPYCMYELNEIWRTSNEGDAFRKRVRIYVVDGVRVREPVDWAGWAVHWKKAHDELDAVVRQHGTTMLGEPGYRRLKQMQGFYTQVADILGTLSNIVQPHSFAHLLRYGFDDPSPGQSQSRPTSPSSRTQPSPLPTASGEHTAGPAAKQLRGDREQGLWKLKTAIVKSLKTSKVAMEAQTSTMPPSAARSAEGPKSDERWARDLIDSLMNTKPFETGKEWLAKRPAAMIVCACVSPIRPLDRSVRCNWRPMTGSGRCAAAASAAFSSAGWEADHLRAVS
nr:toll/interleukin-1 receptor domain-containing protein [uncultured Rhodopila sp.]